MKIILNNCMEIKKFGKFDNLENYANLSYINKYTLKFKIIYFLNKSLHFKFKKIKFKQKINLI